MPPVLHYPPKSRRSSGSFYRRWTWRKQVAASGTRLFFLALFSLLVWGGWYLANKGLGRQFRTTVVEELRKRGIETSVRRLTLDPFRGLVAQDLRIYDFNNRDVPLAVISEVSLDLNYAALLHHQPFLNAIDVRGANLTFPGPRREPNAPRAQLQQFRAHVYFPPNQIYISQAEGIFCGVHLSATGQLLNRADYKPTREVTAAEWAQRMDLLQGVALELGRFNFAGGPPALQVQFSGDLAEMENAHLEGTLRGERMQRGAYEIKNFTAAIEWAQQRLNLAQLEWTDAAGGFSGRASWNTLTKLGDFQAQSSISFRQFAEAFGFGNFFAELNFESPPAIELSGTANFSEAQPSWSAIGRVQLGGFTYKTVPFLGLTSDFSWDGRRTMLRDLHLRHGSGELSADLLDLPGDFRLNFESSISPAALRALVPEGLQQFVSEWEIPKSPAIRLSLRGTSRDPDTWTGDGTLALQRTRFRGVWMNSAHANLHLGDGALSFRELRVTRDEGVGTGSFTYDYKRHEVRLENVKSTLRPSDAIYWVEPKLFKVVVPYKFHSPPSIAANGVVQFHGGKETRLEIAIDAPGGMGYVFLGKTLPLERVHGDLLITDDRVQIREVAGALFGGTVRGTADISVAKNDPHYNASVVVDGVDFPRLTDLYFKYKTARGLLSGTYDFQGLGDDTRAMRGAGKIKVSNGDVFAIPVFGPLSGLISALIPGTGYSIAKQATASFNIKEGVIRTDDFKVAGKLFSMVGHGDIHFLDNKLDFDIRIDASGPGVLLTPVYSLFEYKGEGSLSKPNWHPKNF